MFGGGYSWQGYLYSKSIMVLCKMKTDLSKGGEIGDAVETILPNGSFNLAGGEEVRASKQAMFHTGQTHLETPIRRLTVYRIRAIEPFF